jgi:hypothetical protein
VLNLRPNIMAVMFDPKTAHALLATDKAALWQVFVQEHHIT